jgi:hypothetical protein
MHATDARATTLLVLILALLPGTAARAQTPPAATAPGKAIPTPDQLEPGVDTTRSTPSAAPQAPAPAPAPLSAPPAAASSVPKPAAATPAGAARAPAKKGPDRLNLEATDVTGNSELPKVLYIVPWKRSDLGDMVGRPVNSLLDEVLQPVDRDVFKRENRYYDALKPQAGEAKPDAAQGSGAKP